jgi:hypothetical protein
VDVGYECALGLCLCRPPSDPTCKERLYCDVCTRRSRVWEKMAEHQFFHCRVCGTDMGGSGKDSVDICDVCGTSFIHSLEVRDEKGGLVW